MVTRTVKAGAVDRGNQPLSLKLTSMIKAGSTVPNQKELVKSKSTSVVASVIKEQSQVYKANSGSERDSHAVEGGFVRGGLQRSFTQPCTDLELKEQEEVMSGGTIAERLAKLRQRDSDWEKRNSRINPEDDLNIITAANNHLNQFPLRGLLLCFVPEVLACALRAK
uniref:Uncharacterized protein n=1 Tax=Timema bartmani TaxID=61472 RepID=A0A7R9EQ93_9NEOP|nr:unnamed protein product [Timema bartmani]